MTREPVIGRRFSIRGRVQGVGFRDFAQREALKLGLKGYARNLADGSVLICASGRPSSVSEFESIMRRGPRWAEVSDVVTEEMSDGDFDDFRIVP